MHMLPSLFGRAQAGCLLLQRLFSNAMGTKMVQKRMQGKAGLGTKMVLPCKRMQVLPLRPPPAWIAQHQYRARAVQP